MNPNRKAAVVAVVELAALGLALYLLAGEKFPSPGLSAQRAVFLTCQQIARGFGSLAIKLENDYRVKVAP
jgi:hypothetical protein